MTALDQDAGRRIAGLLDAGAAPATAMLPPNGWRFERIDDRTIHVVCPTFTTPLELSLNSIDRKILAFYGLASDLMAGATAVPAGFSDYCRATGCAHQAAQCPTWTTSERPPYADEHLTDSSQAPAEGDALLRMLANRARTFPNYPLGYHIPEVFSALGEEPPKPNVQPKGLKSVCHMECDGCLDAGKCAHAEKARRDADRDVWMNDYFTLLGDAEIRRMGGETDMPNYLLELAGRIAKAHLDEGYVQRTTELRAAAPAQAPAVQAGPVAWVDERAIAWLANHPKGFITTKLEAVRSVERPMALYGEAQPPVQPMGDANG